MKVWYGRSLHKCFPDIWWSVLTQREIFFRVRAIQRLEIPPQLEGFKRLHGEGRRESNIKNTSPGKNNYNTLFLLNQTVWHFDVNQTVAESR